MTKKRKKEGGRKNISEKGKQRKNRTCNRKKDKRNRKKWGKSMSRKNKAGIEYKKQKKGKRKI